MRGKISFLVIGLLILLSLVLTGCGAQHVYLCSDATIGGAIEIEKSNVIYHCPSGSLTKDINACSFKKQMAVTESDARKNAIQFVEAYVTADSWKASLINAYSQEGAWLAQIVISKRDEQPYESRVKVNGETGEVSCLENCFYIPN